MSGGSGYGQGGGGGGKEHQLPTLVHHRTLCPHAVGSRDPGAQPHVSHTTHSKQTAVPTRPLHNPGQWPPPPPPTHTHTQIPAFTRVPPPALVTQPYLALACRRRAASTMAPLRLRMTGAARRLMASAASLACRRSSSFRSRWRCHSCMEDRDRVMLREDCATKHSTQTHSARHMGSTKHQWGGCVCVTQDDNQARGLERVGRCKKTEGQVGCVRACVCGQGAVGQRKRRAAGPWVEGVEMVGKGEGTGSRR